MSSIKDLQLPGKLFVVEGTDGSGKSTQLSLLYQWLKAEGYPVIFSEWNSSPLVKETTRRAKKKLLFTPTTFSLLHATDFADRTERDILLRSRPGRSCLPIDTSILHSRVTLFAVVTPIGFVRCTILQL